MDHVKAVIACGLTLPIGALPNRPESPLDGSNTVLGIGRTANEAGDCDLGKKAFIARAEGVALGLRTALKTGVPAREAIRAIVKTVRSKRQKVSCM